MYKFYNRNASSIRAIMVANCPWLSDEAEVKKEGEKEKGTSDAEQKSSDDEPGTSSGDRRAGNPLSHYQMSQDVDSDEEQDEGVDDGTCLS